MDPSRSIGAGAGAQQLRLMADNLCALDLRWYSAGALVATRLADDYTVIGSAIGAAPHLGITVPATAEPHLKPRLAESNQYGYFPLDPSALGDFDAVLYLSNVARPTTG